MAEGPPSRPVGRFDDLEVHEFVCTFGPEDRPFEEQHRGCTLAVVHEGTFQYRSGGTTMTMTPGSLILGNPGEFFSCSHEHGRGDRCVSVSIGAATLEEIAREVGARRAGFPQPVAPTHARHFALARALLGTGEDVTPSAEETVRVLAAGILRDQCARPLPLERITWAERRRAVGACRFIESHGDGPLSLTEVARQSGLSAFHFLRSFKRAVGVTPHQYLIHTRLMRAAALLLDTAVPVTTVAYQVGFGDLANFNRSFRLVLGCSPREMRRGRMRRLAPRRPAG